MKLEPPLSNLVNRCQSICVPECCGIDAYDFSPIQIASYLTLHRGKPDASEIKVLRTQIESLRANSNGVTIEEMNQIFTGEQIAALADEMLGNMEIAVKLAQQSEELRYR